MMARVTFTTPGAAQMIESIANEMTVFTIEESPLPGELILVCDNFTATVYRFYMLYSADLASGVGRLVEYHNGMVLFTDETNFDLIMDIQESDYIVPMVEDIEECPVCYEQYEPMYGSLCGHSVCNDCMQKMDDMKLNSCPICRSEDFKYPIAVACGRNFIRV
jgi:zinc-RING finger domain